jgi:hypothetical protein
MSTGPCIVFDKSSLQSRSKVEAFWMAHMFRGVLTQTLLVEIIANLKKAAKEGRRPEDGVMQLAEKIGSLGTNPNLDYAELVIGDLLGHAVDMRGVPLISGGRLVTSKDAAQVWSLTSHPKWQRSVAGGPVTSKVSSTF